MNAINHPRGILAVRAETDVAVAVAKALAEFGTEFKAHKDRTDAEIARLVATIAELEQRQPGASLSAMPGGSAALASTLMKSDAFQAVASKRSLSTSIDVKAGNLLPRIEAAITYDSGGLDTRENVGIVLPPQRRRWLRQLLNQGNATGGSVEFSQETANVVNGADVVGGGSPFQHENVAKAPSVLEWALVEAKIPTIATYIEASRQILADVAELRNVIDTRLRYFLELKLEQQLVAGTGAGSQMKGLTHIDNRVLFTPSSGDTGIDSISRALGILADTYEIIPDLVILSNTAYRAMQRTKAVDSGVYLWGGPGGADTQRIWEIPIHPTPAMAASQFAVTSVEQLGTFRMREDARVEVGYTGSQFTSNMVTILAEIRALLTVERKTATLSGALTL